MNTEIVVILDRSGSMFTIADATISGYNEFINMQKRIGKEPGVSLTVTLAQFDDQYDIVYDNIPIEEVMDLTDKTFIPRGMTSLNDAIGRTISKVSERQSNTCKECGNKNNGKVIVAILTDGAENSSSEYTTKQINALISNKRNDNWEFIFLAANQDAFKTGSKYGIHASDTHNFEANGEGTRSVFCSMSTDVDCYIPRKPTNER